MTPVYALTLVAAVIFAVPAYCQTPAQTPKRSEARSPKKQAATTAKIGTPEAPLVVRIVEVEKSPSPKHHDYFSSEWWLVYLTATLAVFTLGLMLYTARLWRATVKLGIDAQGNADRQAQETQRSLQLSEASLAASNRSAEIAERALVAGERAFISVALAQGPNLDLQENVLGWTFKVIWKNTGNTPTRGMTNHVNIYWPSRPLPTDWDYPDLWSSQTPENERVPVPLIGAPKGGVEGHRNFVPVETIERVIRGELFLYLWGWARYSDVFPATPTRVTRFAARVRIGGDARSTSRISFDYEFLPRYNCADEECALQGLSASATERILVV